MRGYRAWYYFRVGYGAYISLVLGVFSSITVIYKLALDDVPFLASVFPHLILFFLFTIGVGVPTCILIGYLHSKRSNALAADLSISAEMNPYNHRVLAGKEKEVFLPLLVAIAKSLPNPPHEVIVKAEKLLRDENV